VIRILFNFAELLWEIQDYEIIMTEFVAIANTSSVRLSARVIEYQNKIVSDGIMANEDLAIPYSIKNNIIYI
jgi:hypothetical protein